MPALDRPVWWAILVSCALGTLAACSSRPSFALGTDCELATECATPLVCRLGRCREECRGNRDCRAGLVCLRDDGLGACQLDGETCILSSDCAEPLVCLMSRCTNACEEDVDCPPGARCEAEPGGARGCRDTFMLACEHHTECGAVLICAPDGVCREECRTDRDCRDGTLCDEAASPTVCVRPSDLDAGVPGDAALDVGPVDARPFDSGSLDSGALDVGPTDGGPEDGGPIDGGMADAGPVDAGPIDGGPIDTGPDDGGADDAGPVDAGPIDSAIADAGVMTGPAPPPVIAGGERHVCGVLLGELRCWGLNATGQLGDGTILDHRIGAPVNTIAASGIVRVATGSVHSCASNATGLYCWGDNTAGQVGDGSLTGTLRNPVLVAGPATSIATGTDHTCAILAGIVQCWGDNAWGQLGNGSTTLSRTPTPTLALAAAPVELAARGRETCALLSDGRIQCWGENQYGQLGNGTSSTMATPTPQLVVGLTDAMEVAVGITHACARRRDGTVHCWGSNALGALGDGSSLGTERNLPGPVPIAEPAVELVAGGDHVCARQLDGGIECWGGNTFGQVGVNNIVPTPWETLPRTVTTPEAATELAAGDFHTCIRGASGLWCWGWNARGQLGDGTVTESFVPRPVSWP